MYQVVATKSNQKIANFIIIKTKTHYFNSPSGQYLIKRRFDRCVNLNKYVFKCLKIMKSTILGCLLLERFGTKLIKTVYRWTESIKCPLWRIAFLICVVFIKSKDNVLHHSVMRLSTTDILFGYFLIVTSSLLNVSNLITLYLKSEKSAFRNNTTSSRYYGASPSVCTSEMLLLTYLARQISDNFVLINDVILLVLTFVLQA